MRPKSFTYQHDSTLLVPLSARAGDRLPRRWWLAVALFTSCATGGPAATGGSSVYKQVDDHLRADQGPIGACLASPSGLKVRALVIDLLEAGVKSFAVTPADPETEPAKACLDPIVGKWRFDPPAPAPVQLTISTEPFHPAQGQ
jgi:hypothetical protein